MQSVLQTLLTALAAASIGLAAAQAGPGSGPRSPGDLVATLRVPAATFAPGAPIAMTLQLGSNARHPVTLLFRSGQRYDFRILDESGRIVWRWAEGRVFTTALGREEIAPGGTLAYEERFDGTLAPGRYSLVGTVTADGPPLTATRGIEVR